MKTVLTALCAASIAVAVHAQDQKPGLWESRTTKMTIDGKDALASMKASYQQMRDSLAKMPPAQRKQMEDSLGPQGEDPTVQRVCVSAAMIKNQQSMVPSDLNQSDCAPAKVNHDGNRMTFETSCKHGSSGTVTSKGLIVNAKDLVTTTVETVITTAGAKQVMQTEAQMKFIGSDCGGLQPLDEMMKNAHAGMPAGHPATAAPAKK